MRSESESVFYHIKHSRSFQPIRLVAGQISVHPDPSYDFHLLTDFLMQATVFLLLLLRSEEAGYLPDCAEVITRFFFYTGKKYPSGGCWVDQRHLIPHENNNSRRFLMHSLKVDGG